LFDHSGNWLAKILPASVLTSCCSKASGRRGQRGQISAQVLLLFLFIGILEDSGYLARAR